MVLNWSRPCALERLSPANQQMVEIARAISNDARVMIMDEPTAPLAAHEVEILFSVIAKLKARGVTVIYISHRMEEVFAITERISVLRDGAISPPSIRGIPAARSWCA